MKKLVLFALLSFALNSAQAATQNGYIERRALEPAAFPQLVRTLNEELQPGGRFQFVDSTERQRLDRALDEMGKLLSGHATIEQMREVDRVALINAQERANAILTRRDGDRLICKRRALVGSHRPETVCETYAEMMKRTGQSRHLIDEMQKKTVGMRND